jgi:hypothetical protein
MNRLPLKKSELNALQPGVNQKFVKSEVAKAIVRSALKISEMLKNFLATITQLCLITPHQAILIVAIDKLSVMGVPRRFLLRAAIGSKLAL